MRTYAYILFKILCGHLQKFHFLYFKFIYQSLDVLKCIIYKVIRYYFLIMTIRKKSSFIFCLLAFLYCHEMYNESLFYCIIPLRFLSAVWVNWRKCNFYSISGFIFRFVPRSETCLWHTKKQYWKYLYKHENCYFNGFCASCCR